MSEGPRYWPPPQSNPHLVVDLGTRLTAGTLVLFGLVYLMAAASLLISLPRALGSGVLANPIVAGGLLAGAILGALAVSAGCMLHSQSPWAAAAVVGLTLGAVLMSVVLLLVVRVSFAVLASAPLVAPCLVALVLLLRRRKVGDTRSRPN